ncbi:late endosomal/lysosomal adaptor, MAPK and MTOR activator 4 [Oratosquilla oratoria]|uniref:late endosomal/lysosomal adaptor, MAPK and MTOR activator 4 n=1 Tax=Oratosquilla oratoria TaxID=337810 RepID=UPI003F76BFCF
MHGIGRITDEIGHLVLNEDGAVVDSGGELENAEDVANVLMSLIKCTSKASLWPGNSGDAFKKISITYPDHAYVMCLSNKTIYIIKRAFEPQEPINV